MRVAQMRRGVAMLTKKSGRGPPTSPTLRPRVLTPRDHFAHRGGGRAMIMHKSLTGCNPIQLFFPTFFAHKPPNEECPAGSGLSRCFAAKPTRCCAAGL